MTNEAMCDVHLEAKEAPVWSVYSVSEETKNTLIDVFSKMLERMSVVESAKSGKTFLLETRKDGREPKKFTLYLRERGFTTIKDLLYVACEETKADAILVGLFDHYLKSNCSLSQEKIDEILNTEDENVTIIRLNGKSWNINLSSFPAYPEGKSIMISAAKL